MGNIFVSSAFTDHSQTFQDAYLQDCHDTSW